MIVPVEQWAFGEGEVREVEVSDFGSKTQTEAIIRLTLDDVFLHGQNEVQNVEGRYSVSMGDVALLWGKRYLCCSVGWKELSESGYEAYKSLSKEGRQMLLLRQDELLLGVKDLGEQP